MSESVKNLKEAKKLSTDMLKDSKNPAGIQQTLDTIRDTIRNIENSGGKPA